MKLDKVIAVRTTKTVYKDGNYIIKVFNEDYSKADVLNEALNQARVEEIGLNIPRVIEVTKIEGKWAIISEYIEGKTLAYLMEKNADKYDEYLNRFVDLQMSVFSKTCPLLNKLKDKINRELIKTDVDATIRYELHTRLEEMPRHNKLCHGDFVPSNIVITPDDKAYILDWSHATQGNASADVAKTYLNLYITLGSEVAEKYLELFLEKSKVVKQNVLRWLPIVAASLSVKVKEDEKQKLLSFVNVVNYE